MKHLKKEFLLILLSACQFWAVAFDLTKINLQYHYEVNGEIRFSSKVISNDGLWNLYVNIEADSLAQWSSILLMQNSYESIDHDTLNAFSADTFYIDKGSVQLKYAFPKKTLGKLIIFTFSNIKNRDIRYYDVALSPTASYPTFTIFDINNIPITSSYSNEHHVMVPGKYHTYRYSENFGPADPPMGNMKALAPTIDIDTSYFFIDTLKLGEKDQFYLIQKDTLDDSGVTLLSLPYYFPEMRKLEELILPMKYITTTAEYTALKSTINQKKNFERFWINTYGTKFRAKQAIKQYFDQVEQSNRLFTTYKRGWKTDRGLLYIIYGAPDVVIKSEQKEIWKYPNVEYEFVKISTLFAPSIYSLKRDKKYEKEWYRKVGEIRGNNG